MKSDNQTYPDRHHLRRKPQQKRSQERVEKILDAAAIVFDEMGLFGYRISY